MHSCVFCVASFEETQSGIELTNYWLYYILDQEGGNTFISHCINLLITMALG